MLEKPLFLIMKLVIVLLTLKLFLRWHSISMSRPTIYLAENPTEMLSRFLILNNLFTSESLSKTYPQLEPQALHEFFHSVIKEVKVKDKRVEQIIFYSTAGEIIHKFYYR